ARRGEGAYKNDRQLPALQDELLLDESLLSLTHFWLCDNRLVDKNNMMDLVQKVRGTRSYGSAALEFAMVAEGVLDGYLSMKLSPWDVAAGMIIVHEVGGITTAIDGGSVNMLRNQAIITAHPEIIETIIEQYLQSGK